MSKDKIQLLSPLFLKYQTDFEKNPRSRVFAPLAEMYRKLGMTDKAMEILSQGIRFHPGYAMGYLGLAFCYHDIRQFTLAYSTLRPLVEGNRDNIRLQKLFADVCLELNYKEEALDTYKYLLFINPRDKEVAAQVTKLERIIEEQYRPVHQPIYIPEAEFTSPQGPSYNSQIFDTDKLENRPNASKADFDDWMALDLSREQKSNIKTDDPHDFWNLKKGDAPLDLTEVRKEEVELAEEKVEASAASYNDVSLDEPEEIRDYFDHELKIDLDLDDESDNESDEEKDEQEEQDKAEIPLVTHTLVDLYCGQGHMEKALEVLEKILILNPKDQRTIDKISEIRSLMSPFEETSSDEEEQESEYEVDEMATFEKVPEEFQVAETILMPNPVQTPALKPKLSIIDDISEEDGRKHLMSFFDEQIKPQEVEEVIVTPKVSPKTDKKAEKVKAVEEKMAQFLKKIQKRALDYQARV